MQRPLSVLKIGGLLLAVGLVVSAGWLVWRTTRKGPIITTYSQCMAALDSVVQESYPETCVTGDGKRFVNPDASVTLPPSEQ